MSMALSGEVDGEGDGEGGGEGNGEGDSEVSSKELTFMKCASRLGSEPAGAAQSL